MKITYLQIFWLVFFNVATTTIQATVRVETTTQDLAAIAKAIGGEFIDVHSLTLGTRDPHFAVAKPSMIRRVYRADTLFVIGADMEIGWLPPLLQSARNARVQPGNPGYLDLSQSIQLLGKQSGPVTRAMGDVHAKGNPHYWLDPRNGVRMAKTIAKHLGQLDPDHAVDYLANFEIFENTVNTKFIQWQTQLKHLNNKPFIAYHTSLVYLADAFNFRIVDEVEPKPGISPSASSLNALITRINKERIGFLIMEPYYERRSARYLNDQTGIRDIVLPQSVGAEPMVKTYTDLFDAIVKALQPAGAS